MSTFHPNRMTGARGRSGIAGFTLVELLIAMILGLIVIAGVTSVFLAGQRSFRTNNALADVQDSSRIAFELMARDIRDAGLTGCNSVNNRVSNVTKAFNTSTPAEWWADWSNTVHGYDDATTDPALASQTGVLASAGSLKLMSAGSPPVAIASDVPTSKFTLNAATTNLKDGDLAMVCSPSQATILRIGYTAGGTDVDFDVAGNCATNLGYENNACTSNNPDYTYPPNSLISKVTATDWFLAANNAGGTSLYRISLQNQAGAPTPVASEMVRNVTGMTISYLDPGIAAIGNKFVDAATIDANGGWLGVTAVHVELTLESTFKRASVNGDKPVQRIYAFTTTLRNRVN